MVSLWGTKDSKKGDGPEEGQHQGEGSRNTRERHSQDADERTRLLQSHQRHDGYLDPDDPAVRISTTYKTLGTTELLHRSPPTTSGASELPAISPFCSLSSPFSGGYC